MSIASELINLPFFTGVTSIDHKFLKNNKFVPELEVNKLLTSLGVNDYIVIYYLHTLLQE